MKMTEDEKKARNRAYNKAYNETHKAERKAYDETHKAEHKARSKVYKNKPENRFKTCRKMAKVRNLEFNLSLAEYLELITLDQCSYCRGPLPILGHGLDRVDNSKGYTKDNVVACCGPCNRFRGDSVSHTDFIKIMNFVIYNGILINGDNPRSNLTESVNTLTTMNDKLDRLTAVTIKS
jgi:hypothetical protein